MKISLNTIKWYGYEHVLDVPLDVLTQKIGAQLGALEEQPVYLGERYEGLYVVEVKSVSDHPNADRLHVCLIDDGGVVTTVERNNDGLVQVVCGAPNVKAGMLVAWLPPGSTVPKSANTNEPFVLTARDFRGVNSNGMLASASELAIADDHSGLLEIVLEEVGEELAKPGTPFKSLFGLDDTILEIENKMFTHRPDCFGLLGIGRELAGIQNKAFKSPDWYALALKVQTGNSLKLNVRNELPELVPRYTALALTNINVKPSPIWMQSTLSRLGLKPINNVVDITNFYMLLTGQPLHAYDYDKLKALDKSDGVTLVIRNPRDNERIALLNGKTINPRQEAIMIATETQLVGVGGVMGGTDTEVDDTTTSVVLEAATFDMFSIRRTAMAHGLFTDAVTRFNKGQSPLQNLAVLSKAVESLAEYAAALPASDLVDDNHLDEAVITRNALYNPVTVTTDFINERLGLVLTADGMKQLLENVEFEVTVAGNTLQVKAPFWRTDIEQREDVVEEIGRLNGYDTLPLVLPNRDLSPALPNERLSQADAIRTVLSQNGANEVLSYSFVHGALLTKAGQDTTQAFKLSNALSPELQYYRLSIVPSLLDKVHANSKAGYDTFALFELGKAHHLSEVDSDGIPHAQERLGFVYSAKSNTASAAAFYVAKIYALHILESFTAINDWRLQALHEYSPAQSVTVQSLTAPYEPTRAAVLLNSNDEIIGVVGEFKSSVKRSFKLSDQTAGFEIDRSKLTVSPTISYQPLPRFPKVTQDLSLRVPVTVNFETIYTCIRDALKKAIPESYRWQLHPLDIFQRTEALENLQYTFRITIASYEHTLTDAVVQDYLNSAAAVAKDQLGAEVL